MKRHIFDSLLFTYTAALVAYFAGVPAVWEQESFLQATGAFGAFFIAVLAGSAVLTLVLNKSGITTLGTKLLNGRPGAFWKWHLTVVLLLTLAVSVLVTEASLTELSDADGLAGAVRLWSGLSHPNPALFPKAIAQAMETIFIAFLATVLAIPLAFFAAFFCAKNIMASPAQLAVYTALRILLNVTRSVEPLIWALIFTVWVGVGPFAGMLALMVHSAASLTKYYSEIIENVSTGPIEAIRSTGANAIQVVWYAVVPQVVLPYIAMTVYRWDTNVRMATVIGLVGGGGIGTLLIQYQGQAMWPEVGTIIIVIAVVVWLLDTASAHLREALR